MIPVNSMILPNLVFPVNLVILVNLIILVNLVILYQICLDIIDFRNFGQFDFRFVGQFVRPSPYQILYKDFMDSFGFCLCKTFGEIHLAKSELISNLFSKTFLKS